MTRFDLLFSRTADFQQRVFPKQSLASTLTHLGREIEEIKTQPTDIEEFADALILLLGCANKAGFSAAQLLQAAHAKMDVNNLRRWSPADAQGVHHHIEEPRRREVWDGALQRKVVEV